MSVFRHIKTFTAVFLPLIIAFAFVSWLLKSDVAKAQNQDRLTLEASTSQDKYVQLEPIPFSFKISNRTTLPITWVGMIYEDQFVFDKEVNFLVRGEGNELVRHKGANRSGDFFPSSEVLQAGESKETRNLLEGRLLESLFPQPGNYQLQFEFTYSDFSGGHRRDLTILSNPVNIKIIEPKGVNLAAYNYLKTTYESVYRSGTYDEVTRMKQHFADNFSGSVYWRYIVFDLANSYSWSDKYEKAEREFLKIADTEFYHSRDLRKRLREVGERLGKSYPNLKDPVRYIPPPTFRIHPVPHFTPGPALGPAPVPIRIPNPNPNPTSTP